MPLLAIKLDAITKLREDKRSRDPDPAQLAPLAELGGADAITAALHSSRTLIRDRDIYLLKEIVKTRFILEIAPTEDLLAVALEVRPWMVTLRGENPVDPYVTEPLAYNSALESIAVATERLKGAGIISSHCIQPTPDDVKNAARCKAEYIALTTDGYVTAESLQDAENELEDIDRMSQMAQKLGIGVHCGGGLNYKNAPRCAELNLIEQVTVGRAVVRRALLTGVERAVAELRAEINRKL